MLSCAQTIRDELESFMEMHPGSSVVHIRRDYAVTLTHLLAHLIELDRKLDELHQSKAGNSTGTARSLA